MNRGFTYSEKVGIGSEGVPLLDYLARRYTHSPEADWKERIESGRVRVNGDVAPAELVLKRGQRVEWARPPWQEPEAPLTFAILHADDTLLVVAKPSGLPTLPGGGYLENTLLHLVRRRFPGAAPMHRLGRGTSGVVLFARDAGAAEAISRSWREREVTKVYRALVTGEPGSDRFDIDAPIGPVPHRHLGTLNAADPHGKPSRSRMTVLERRGDRSLVEVEIETGRPHQIRIHAAFCGHPLWGDPLYGPGGLPLEGGRALPGECGYLLHSMRLSLIHPKGVGLFRVECRPPAPLRTAAEG